MEMVESLGVEPALTNQLPAARPIRPPAQQFIQPIRPLPQEQQFIQPIRPLPGEPNPQVNPQEQRFVQPIGPLPGEPNPKVSPKVSPPVQEFIQQSSKAPKMDGYAAAA